MSPVWKERLTNAGILLIVGAVVVLVLWYLSVGLYALGMWPIAALIRVFVWGFALFCLYWIARHLLGHGGTEDLLRRVEERTREIEARNLLMRDRAYMERVTGEDIDPELWKTAMHNTSGVPGDAARLWGEYSILKHQRDLTRQGSSSSLA